MKFMLVTALIFALNSPCADATVIPFGGVVCDTVETSVHGTLIAKRVTDGKKEIMKICIGQLRLFDPKNNMTYCLAKNETGKEEEVLECGNGVGNGKNTTTVTGGKCRTNNSTIQMPEKLVISSTGVTAKAQSGAAGWLGQYEIVRDPDKIRSAEVYYMQSNPVGKNSTYLFPDRYCQWSVSMKPNERNYERYRNKNKKQTVPTGTGGWKIYHEGRKMWMDDPTLTVTPGPYPVIARNGFNVIVSGDAARMYNVSRGYFRKTNEWWMGRPVFKNNQGRILLHGNLGWYVGTAPGYWEIRGNGSHQSPVDQRKWEYLYTTIQHIDWDQDVWENATVRVVKDLVT